MDVGSAQPNMQNGSRSSAGETLSSPRNTLHTAAAASAIWQSGSPEPPVRTVSPTRLGTKSRDSQSSPGTAGSPRKSVRHSFKSLKQTSTGSLQQLAGADEVRRMQHLEVTLSADSSLGAVCTFWQQWAKLHPAGEKYAQSTSSVQARAHAVQVAVVSRSAGPQACLLEYAFLLGYACLQRLHSVVAGAPR